MILMKCSEPLESVIAYVFFLFFFCYFQSCLVAIVVPDAEILPGLAEKLGVKGSFEELCRNQV